jgi:hypothetical protein
VSVATVLPIIIIHVGACYAFDGLSHSFVAFAYQEVEVVAHKTVCVIGAVASGDQGDGSTDPVSFCHLFFV